jgi:hypothetical protein
MRMFSRFPPGAALVIVAVLAVVVDISVSQASGPAPTTITVYNRTTAAITFTTGDTRKVATYVPSCTTIEFEVIQHEWRLVGQPASPMPGAAQPVAVDVDSLIPPVPDASGPNYWEVVVAADRMDGGLAYPGRPTPPPCNGPPREPISLAGNGNVTAGPYTFGGRYEMALSISVPGGTACGFGATKHRFGGKFEELFIFDRVLSADLSGDMGPAYFDPAQYEFNIHSACGPWTITLTPIGR